MDADGVYSPLDPSNTMGRAARTCLAWHFNSMTIKSDSALSQIIRKRVAGLALSRFSGVIGLGRMGEA